MSNKIEQDLKNVQVEIKELRAKIINVQAMVDGYNLSDVKNLANYNRAKIYLPELKKILGGLKRRRNAIEALALAAKPKCKEQIQAELKVTRAKQNQLHVQQLSLLAQEKDKERTKRLEMASAIDLAVRQTLAKEAMQALSEIYKITKNKEIVEIIEKFYQLRKVVNEAQIKDKRAI